MATPSKAPTQEFLSANHDHLISFLLDLPYPPTIVMKPYPLRPLQTHAEQAQWALWLFSNHLLIHC